MRASLRSALAAVGAAILLAVAMGARPALADTVLYFQSQPGDFIGGGQTRTIRPEDGYTLNAWITAISAEFQFQSASMPPLPYWRLDLHAPSLQVGTYEVSERTPFGSMLTMDFWGDGRGCTTTSGRFNVLEMTRDASSQVQSFAVDFEQHCNGHVAAAFGQLRYNSAIPVDTTRRHPDPWVFSPVSGVAPGEVATSATATISGIEVTLPLSIEDGEYSVDGGPFTALPGTVIDGQTVRVRVAAPPQPNATATAVLHVGEFSAPFLVGTDPGPAPQPDGRPLVVLDLQPIGANPARRWVFSPATLATVEAMKGPSQYTVSGTVENAWGYDDFARFSIGGYGSTLPTPGIYTSVAHVSDATHALLNLSLPQGIGCSGDSPLNRYTLHEAAYRPDGVVERLAFDFVASCTDGSGPAVFGYVRYNSTVPIDYSVAIAHPFTFGPVADVAPGAVVDSSEATIEGINVPVPVTVSGGEYSLNGGAFTSAAGMVVAGQRLRLRALAPPLENALSIARVEVGVRTAEFRVGTRVGANPQPNGADLLVLVSDIGDGVGLGATNVFSAATLHRIDVAIESPGTLVATARDGPFDLLARAYFSAPGGALPTPKSYLAVAKYASATRARLDASIDYRSCAETYGNFVVHEVEHSTSNEVLKLAVDFVQACAGGGPALRGYLRYHSSVPVAQVADGTPAPFSFPNAYNVAPGAIVTSGTVTLGGMNVPGTISISGGEYSLDGGGFTSSPGTILAGQTLAVRLVAATTPGATVLAAVTIGGFTAHFSATTQLPDTTPDPFVLGSRLDVPTGQWIYSPRIPITGFFATAIVTIIGGEVSVGGQPFTPNPTAIDPGQDVQVRVMSSDSYGDYRVGILVIGGVSGSFTTKTASGPTLSVTVTNGSGGWVYSSPPAIACPPTCSATVEVGAGFTLVAIAAEGASFAGWSVGCSGTGNCVVLVGSSVNVTATFTYPITVTRTGTGSGTVRSQPLGLQCGATCTTSFTAGSQVALEATPAIGSRFMGWGGSCTGSAAGCLVSMDAAKGVTASFAPLVPSADNARHDWNGDGRADLALRHLASGVVYACFFVGLDFDRCVAALAPGASVRIVGAGDVNGDGFTDFIGQDAASGQVAVWYMEGASNVGSASLLAPGAEWRVETVADFDADGRPDLLLRHLASHQLHVVYFQGATPVGAQFLVALDGDWRVEGTGDFDRDGHPDLVLRHSTGVAYAWRTGYAEGATSLLGAPAGLFSLDPSWEVGQMADWDGDGNTDIVVRSAVTGEVFVLYFAGTAFLGGDWIANYDAGWEIVPRP